MERLALEHRVRTRHFGGPPAQELLVGHGLPRDRFAAAGEAFGADGAAAVYGRETLLDCVIQDEVFDTNMPGWGCDADLAWRGRLLGWRTRYEPSAVVHHIQPDDPRPHQSGRSAHAISKSLSDDGQERLRRRPRAIASRLVRGDAEELWAG